MNKFCFDQILGNYPCAMKKGRKAFAPYKVQGATGPELRIATYKQGEDEDPVLVSDLPAYAWFEENRNVNFPQLAAFWVLERAFDEFKCPAEREIYLNSELSRGNLPFEAEKVIRANI